MSDDFCVGKLLRECEQEKKAILSKPFSLANFWGYLIAGADKKEVREYVLKGIKELEEKCNKIVSNGDKEFYTMQIGKDLIELNRHERFGIIITLKEILGTIGEGKEK